MDMITKLFKSGKPRHQYTTLSDTECQEAWPRARTSSGGKHLSEKLGRFISRIIPKKKRTKRDGDDEEMVLPEDPAVEAAKKQREERAVNMAIEKLDGMFSPSAAGSKK